MSLARKTQACATSSVVPGRFMGMRLHQVSISSLGTSAVISVSMKPGHTTLTRMLRVANSLAQLLLKPMMPAFEAA